MDAERTLKMTTDDEDIIPNHEYEIVAMFRSQFSGWCTLVDVHKIRKNDLVGKLQRADNPTVSVPGVACPICCLDIPRARV